MLLAMTGLAGCGGPKRLEATMAGPSVWTSGESGLHLSLAVRYPITVPGQSLVLEVFRALSGRS